MTETHVAGHGRFWPISPTSEVAVPPPCAEFSPPPTPSGFYGPLGGIPPVFPSSQVFYVAGSTPRYPRRADHSTDNWAFPVFQLAGGGSPAGFYDTAWAQASSIAECYVVGPGTMTIYTGVGFREPGRYELKLWHGDAVTADFPPGDVLGNFAAGTSHVVTVPDDGHCAHCVTVLFLGLANVNYTGFAGFGWAATFGGETEPPEPSEPPVRALLRGHGAVAADF